MTKDAKPLSKEDLAVMLVDMRQTDIAAHAALEDSIDFSKPVNVLDPTAREMIDNLLHAEDEIAANYGITRKPIVLPEKFINDNLERDGCNLIRGAYVFLAALGYPPNTRDFILLLMGLSGGNYTEEQIITEEMLQKHMGWSAEVLRRKRHDLMDFEDSNTFTLVQIREGERDKDDPRRRWKPTSYQVMIVKHVADFIRKTRDRTFWREKKEKLIDVAANAEVETIAKQIAQTSPNSPIVRRVASRGVRPRGPETLIEKMASRSDVLMGEVLRKLELYIELQLQMGVELTAPLEKLQIGVRATVAKYCVAFPEVKGPISKIELALKVSGERRNNNGLRSK